MSAPADRLPQSNQRTVERGSWVEPYPTALCRDDRCPWKYVGTYLEITQQKAEAHALESGHAVRIYRQLHRDIEVTDG